MVNTALLQQTLEHIKANPEGWSQCRWTTCFGGTALRLNGQDPEDMSCAAISRAAHELLGFEFELVRCCDRCGDVPQQDHKLFGWDNTLDDLERIVQELTAEQVPA